MIRVALLYINREGNNLAREKHSRESRRPRLVLRDAFLERARMGMRRARESFSSPGERKESEKERYIEVARERKKKKKCEREEEEPRSGEGRRDNGCT